MLSSQRGTLCTRSEISHRSSIGASDESYELENLKFAGTIGWTNDRATWPSLMNRNIRGYLIQIGPPTITAQFSPETRVIGRF